MLLFLQKYSNGIRFVLMVLGGMLSVLGSKAINFPSAGALGCIIIACICRIFWKKAKHTESVSIMVAYSGRMALNVLLFVCSFSFIQNLNTFFFRCV